MNDGIRKKNWKYVEKLGLKINTELPFIDNISLKPLSLLANRLYAMHGLAALAYGWDNQKALHWYSENQLNEYLTDKESDFLSGNKQYITQFKFQIEAMWALAWVLSLTDELDFTKQCANNFVAIMPNLKDNTNLEQFSQNFKVRPESQIYEKLDLAYCLHWDIVGLRCHQQRFQR